MQRATCTWFRQINNSSAADANVMRRLLSWTQRERERERQECQDGLGKQSGDDLAAMATDLRLWNGLGNLL